MPRAHSADVPRYDTYPAPTPSEAAASAQDWPYEPKTDVDRRTQCGNPRLNDAAAQVGETLGRVVSIARSLPRRVENLKDRVGTVRASGPTVDLMDRVSDLGDQAKSRMQDLRDRVEGQFNDAREAARHRLDEARSMARRRLDETRERARLRAEQARQYAHANPLQVIAAAALAGLALGAGLRLWRSSHE